MNSLLTKFHQRVDFFEVKKKRETFLLYLTTLRNGEVKLIIFYNWKFIDFDQKLEIRKFKNGRIIIKYLHVHDHGKIFCRSYEFDSIETIAFHWYQIFFFW